MMKYVSINCKMVPVIDKVEDHIEKYYGIRRGSMLMISNDCVIPSDLKIFLDSKVIIIFRLPDNGA